MKKAGIRAKKSMYHSCIFHIQKKTPRISKNLRNFGYDRLKIFYIYNSDGFSLENREIQACKHNHAFFGTKCPECGEPVETEYTRVVGFYVPVKTYSSERKQEFYFQ